jgi:hypothetical protein
MNLVAQKAKTDYESIALPLFSKIAQPSLAMLYCGMEVLFRELGDRRSVASPILFTLLGVLIAYFLLPSVTELSTQARLVNSFRNFIRANHDRPGSFLIVISADQCSEAASGRIEYLIREISLAQKVSSSSDTEDRSSRPQRRASFPRLKKVGRYPGYYRDLHDGKIVKGCYVSE